MNTLYSKSPCEKSKRAAKDFISLYNRVSLRLPQAAISFPEALQRMSYTTKNMGGFFKNRRKAFFWDALAHTPTIFFDQNVAQKLTLGHHLSIIDMW